MIASNFAGFAMKLMLVVGLFEGYFLLLYFLSTDFLDKVSHLVDELSLLLSRAPAHSFLLLMEKYA